MAGIWSRFFGSSVSTATGLGIGSALAPALIPVTQGVANETWSLHPNRPLSAQTVAELALKGYITMEVAELEARNTGFDADRLAALIDSQQRVVDPLDFLNLWNRGVIDEGQVLKGLRQSGMREEWWGPFRALRRYLPSVSDLITWGVREVFSPSQRQSLDLDAEFPTELGERLGEQGFSPEDSRNAWAAHWQLPSRGEGADMWHRGLLTDAQYDGLLKALDYAPTWRDKLREISNAIPGLSDMVRFAVREVYDPASRARLSLDQDYPAAFTVQARKHGLTEADARDYWAAHWNLPSPTQMYAMLHRDLISLSELDDGLKAADYAPVWRDKLRDIAYLVPGRVDLRRMLAAGVVDRAYVKTGYLHIGYDEATAEILTDFAVQQAASGSTVHQKWADRAKSRLFTIAHNEYLDDSLDAAGVSSALDVVGVPANERPAILAAWNKENEISRLELTAAQIKKAYGAAGMTRTEAITRLEAKGMTAADADLYLDPSGAHE